MELEAVFDGSRGCLRTAPAVKVTDWGKQRPASMLVCPLCVSV